MNYLQLGQKVRSSGINGSRKDGKRGKMEISIQLYSVHTETEKDFKGAVEKVADIGFQGVEFAGYGGLSAEEMAAFLKEKNLYSVGAHVGVQRFEEGFLEELGYHKAIGSKYIICPYASTETLEEVKELAEVLNNAARLAEGSGIKVGYHNHAQEFKIINGKYALDLLAELTREDVILELDVFWAAYAGVEPVDYIKKSGKKIELIHMKQINETKENVDMPEGCLDMKTIQEAAEYASYFVLEHEEYDKPIWESIQNDYEFLKKL
ncbi:sugar phosphate isomerase/epimerase family protein [Anaerocolumna xylanovorans]|uniref:Sugar phosphate isomerase/epimerase n=1 Tax=Anaerocolumna xylanovorans DSM 12503 TaxID=1121345 RepID=A0A1M7YL45_9FIRM|nr:sugar phosphate isomerase/epimerase [Anaerocolumna xylanovorans]SHO53351.1 Sugar phosphate isomerase/epimerase [Anaerocolumna xylanovorans DSM 12503]